MRKLITILLMVLSTLNILAEGQLDKRIIFYDLKKLPDLRLKLFTEEIKAAGIILDEKEFHKKIDTGVIAEHQNKIILYTTRSKIEKLNDAYGKIMFSIDFYKKYKTEPLNPRMLAIHCDLKKYKKWQKDEVINLVKELGLVKDYSARENLFRIDEKREELVLFTTLKNDRAISRLLSQFSVGKFAKCTQEQFEALRRKDEEKKRKAKSIVRELSSEPPEYQLLIKILPKNSVDKQLEIEVLFVKEVDYIAEKSESGREPEFGLPRRRLSQDLPFDGSKTLVGFLGEKEGEYSKPVIINGEAFYYLQTTEPSQQNGMFQLSKVEGQENNFRLKGVYWVCGQLTVMNDIITEAEPTELYQYIPEPKPY